MLFGDVPLSDWKATDAPARTLVPWSCFETARTNVERQDQPGAIAALREVVETPNLETRQYLQAWHALRELGIQPEPHRAKQVMGAVLEVGLEGGLDTLAAYSDSTARYISHGGRTIVWDAVDEEITDLIGELLRAGQAIADNTSPWPGVRRPAPPENHVRLNMLTPSGLHFGEGPFVALAADPIGGPVIAAGTALMEALINRTDPPAS